MWAALLAACAEARRPPDPPRLPSLLLVTIDTLRASAVSAYGEVRCDTPHLDRLARRGVLWPRAYSATDLTNPSHATLLTGVPPARHGVYTLQAPLPNGVPTLAETLARRGYATAAIVSVSHLRNEMSGLARGFEVYDVPASERPAEEDVPLVRECVIGRVPFFLWLHLFDPHMPYDPPPPFREWALLEVSDRPLPPPLAELTRSAHVPFPYRSWLEGMDLSQLRALYHGEVARADDALGRVVALARRADPTAVIAVTSDHGEGFGEHGVYWNHFGLNEEMVRVPLVIEAPGRLPGGALLPGVLPASHLRALLSDLVLGPPGGVPIREADRAAFEMRFRSAHGYVRGHEKVIHLQGYAAPLPRGTQLYDLDRDPGETSDLGRDRMADRDLLDREVETYLAAERARGAGPVADLEVDEETRDKLRALGYVE